MEGKTIKSYKIEEDVLTIVFTDNIELEISIWDNSYNLPYGASIELGLEVEYDGKMLT